jgi:hypothetical protein
MFLLDNFLYLLILYLTLKEQFLAVEFHNEISCLR